MKLTNIDYKTFLGIFLLLLSFDALYITAFNSYFKRLFKTVQGGRKLSIKYGGFIATYLFMSSILYYFGIVKRFTPSEMFLLGISIYGVYELTNYATLVDWTMQMVVLDTLWGGILFMTTLHVLQLLKLKMQ
uniref:DUF2177 family protein n=1 Tax=viral metagenome TaxID=1070528 RepID=A0A6C0KWP3_9ZZZZ|tara:strand:- start:4 stop:399 length:396 start_codon:yes stop_codon:yes gene_type:complete